MTPVEAKKIEALRNSFRGEILLPGNEAYESARSIWIWPRVPDGVSASARTISDHRRIAVMSLDRQAASASVARAL